MFEVGARVIHERFGVGIVLEAESVTFSGHPSQDLQIDFGGKVGVKGYYCPPAILRDVATEAPLQDGAPASLGDGEEARRIKLSSDWGGPPTAAIAVRLTVPDKKQIKDQFDDAVTNFGLEADVKYIEALIQLKLDWLETSALPWERRLGAEMAVLSRLFESHQSGNATLADEEFRVIGATLFWLVNLYDYVPDATPAHGHLDDALVLDHCIKKLRQLDNPRFVQ